MLILAMLAMLGIGKPQKPDVEQTDLDMLLAETIGLTPKDEPDHALDSVTPSRTFPQEAIALMGWD